MNFIDAVKICFSKYAVVSGRATRPEYWWFFLFIVLASIVLSYVSTLLGNLFSLAVLVPSITVGVRRLHDTNKSGWWMLLLLLPVVGWIILLIFMVMGSTQGANRFG